MIIDSMLINTKPQSILKFIAFLAIATCLGVCTIYPSKAIALDPSSGTPDGGGGATTTTPQPTTINSSGNTTPTGTTANVGGGSATASISPVVGNMDATSFLMGVLGRLQSLVTYLALLFIVIGAVLYLLAPYNENLTKTAKACWTSALIGLVIVVAAPSILQTLNGIAFNGTFPQSIEQIPGLKSIVLRMLAFLLSIVGILGIIGLVISGIMYLLAIGDKSMADHAKKAIRYSLTGIALAGGALIIITQIAALITR